jgi:hypothetical protein
MERVRLTSALTIVGVLAAGTTAALVNTRVLESADGGATGTNRVELVEDGEEPFAARRAPAVVVPPPAGTTAAPATTTGGPPAGEVPVPTDPPADAEAIAEGEVLAAGGTEPTASRAAATTAPAPRPPSEPASAVTEPAGPVTPTSPSPATTSPAPAATAPASTSTAVRPVRDERRDWWRWWRPSEPVPAPTTPAPPATTAPRPVTTVPATPPTSTSPPTSTTHPSTSTAAPTASTAAPDD